VTGVNVALEPIIRILVTFAIVWFYHALTTPFVPSGLVQFAVVVVLAIPTWIVVSRTLLPKDGTSMPWQDEK
jgi:hypothetical protein